MTPSVYQTESPQTITDVWQLLQTYAKSIDVFYCPDRTQAGCGYSEGYEPASARCIGYGYDWGPWQNSNGAGEYEGGLLNELIITGPPGAYIFTATGKSLAAILAPSETFAFGDTYDRPWYTNSLNNTLYTFTGTTNSALPHGGRFNVNYVDGHSKSMAWRGFLDYYGKGYVVPRNTADYTKWCADPDAVIWMDLGTMPCGQVANTAVQSLLVKWFPD